MKRTKIVCTVGPACEKKAILKSMMRAGMDVCRLNFSHGTHAGHRRFFREIRSAAKEIHRSIAIIGDLQGPKIRLGELPSEGVMLKMSEEYIFTTNSDSYSGKSIPVTYKNLHKDVNAGDRFLIDDGLIELHITKIQKRDIHATVINGGIVTSHKGMNFPDSRLSVSALTEKDKEDVRFAVELGVEWIALSFVKDAKDILQLKQLIKKFRKPGQLVPRVIAKIEKHEAIESFAKILAVTDAVMIARGDLGVEILAQEVPIRQKELIEQCRVAGKPVIVATQMLDSMIRNPRPTRAEVSDVANAVFDHTDAVMLSGESANGKYPLKAVRMMATIVEEAEASPFDDVALSQSIPTESITGVTQTIKLAAVQGSIDAVLVSLHLADWAETIHLAHPEIPLFLACETEAQARQVSLRWGSIPFVLSRVKEETFVKRAIDLLKKTRQVKKGMMIAVVLGGKHGKSFDVIEV